MSKIVRAFQESEHTIRRVIGRYCKRQEDVEDLAQQTFVRSFAAELKEEIREPRAFLIRVARNLALSEIKRHSNTKTDSLEDFGASEVLLDERIGAMEESLDARRKLEVIAKALATLPEESREALAMRKIDGLRFKEIALRQGVTVSAVEKRVARALMGVSVYLREQGHDPADFGALIAEKKPKDTGAPDKRGPR